MVLVCQIYAHWLLTEHHDAVRAHDPGLDVVVLYVLDEASLGPLASSRLDAVVLWAPVPPELAEHHVVLAHEEVLAVVRADHPLAKNDSVRVADLAGSTCWLWPEDIGRPARQRITEHLGLPPHALAAVRSVGPAQELMIQTVREKAGSVRPRP